MHAQEFPFGKSLRVVWEIPERSCDRDGSDRACLFGGAAESTPPPDAILDQIAAIASELVLHGGSFSTQQMLALIAGADARGLRVSCRVAAESHSEDNDFAALRQAGVRRMIVPLNGAFASTHDAFHDSPRSWNRMLRTLTAARRARIPVEIATVFNTPRMKEWWKIVQLVRNLQAEQWRVALFVPARAHRFEMPDAWQAEALLRALVVLPTGTGLKVCVEHAPQFRRVVMQSRDAHWSHPPSEDARRTITLSRHGEIMPSERLPVTCGNIRCHDLSDTYDRSTVFRRLRNPDRLKGKCGRCEYRVVCGGSRARAYAITGDYLAPDPACPYEPGSSRAAHEPLLFSA